MNNNEIFSYLKKNIGELLSLEGVNCRIVGSPMSEAYLNLKFGDNDFRLQCDILSSGSFAVLRERISLVKASSSVFPRIIISEFMSGEKQKICRDEGIFYLDLSGNVFIRKDSFLIDRSGYPNLFPEKRGQRNPFSDKASLVLRALIKEYDKSWGIREIASETGIDPGFVSRLVGELENRSYIRKTNSKIKPANIEGILEDWVHAYSYKKNMIKKYFSATPEPSDIIKLLTGIKGNYALSLQAGASLIAPHASFNEVHIYTGSDSIGDTVRNKLRLKEVDRGANVFIMNPYYTQSVFYGLQHKNGINIVSNVQLYLDLYNYPLRGLEQAEHIYRKKLKHVAERNSDE